MDNFGQYYKNLGKPVDNSFLGKAERCISSLRSSYLKHLSEAEFAEKMKFYMRKLNISEAGPVPNSLLARQDLAGVDRTEKTLVDHASFSVWYYDSVGAQKCAVFGNLLDAEAYAALVDTMGFKNVEVIKGQMEKAFGKAQDLVKLFDKYYIVEMEKMNIEKSLLYQGFEIQQNDSVGFTVKLNGKLEWTAGSIDACKYWVDKYGKDIKGYSKGQVETTGQQLQRLANKAEEAETVSEKNTLVQNLKAVQLKRQKATIAAREKDSADKSFKDFWREKDRSTVNQEEHDSNWGPPA